MNDNIFTDFAKYNLPIGWYVFAEAQTIESLTGIILVVIGVVLSVIYSKRRKNVEAIEATAG